MNLPTRTRSPRVPFLALVALGAGLTAHACPCGCVKVCVDNLADRPLATPTDPRVFDVRFDAIDQNERNDSAHAHWYGSHFLTTASVEMEIAGRTWSLSVPRVERHLHTDKVPSMANPNPTQYSQTIVGLGDISLGTRFAWEGCTVNFGVKFPTGSDHLVFADPAGGLSRRYLQPGTGSTDLLAGFRRDFGAKDARLTEFLQCQAQGALLADSHFRPGTTVSLSGGVRYALTESLAISAQATLLRQFRDKNTQATVDATYAEDLESGGLSTTLATGISYRFSPQAGAYLFYSEPVVNRSYVPKSGTALVNPVHATAIWSLGFMRTF